MVRLDVVSESCRHRRNAECVSIDTAIAKSVGIVITRKSLSAAIRKPCPSNKKRVTKAKDAFRQPTTLPVQSPRRRCSPRGENHCRVTPKSMPI